MMIPKNRTVPERSDSRTHGIQRQSRGKVVSATSVCRRQDGTISNSTCPSLRDRHADDVTPSGTISRSGGVIMRVSANDHVRARVYLAVLSVATTITDTFRPFRCRISRRRHTYIHVGVLSPSTSLSLCPGRPRKRHSVRSKSDFSHRHGYSAISRRPARAVLLLMCTLFFDSRLT